MPIYLVEQKGIPGARLVDAEKPQGAINHVVDSLFTCKRVDGRQLLDVAKLYELETAGAPKEEPEPQPEPEPQHAGLQSSYAGEGSTYANPADEGDD